MALVNWFQKLPKWVKIILALPVINLVWGIYRIVASAVKGHWLFFVLALLMFFIGIAIWWIVDIIWIIIFDRICWFD